MIGSGARRLGRVPEHRQLMHGLYSKADSIHSGFETWALRWDLDYRDFVWRGDSLAPKYVPDPGVAVVLVPHLETPERTIRFALDWFLLRAGRSVDEELQPSNIRLQPHGEAFQPLSVGWARVKLNQYPNCLPVHLLHPRSPGLAALFAAAQHPVRVDAIGQTPDALGWHVPGLQVANLNHELITRPRDQRLGDPAWGSTLLVTRDYPYRTGARLGYYYTDGLYGHGLLAVPEYYR